MDDVLLEQRVDALVHLLEGKPAASSSMASTLLCELQDELTHHLEVASLDTLGVGGTTLGKTICLEHDTSLLHKVPGSFFVAGRKNMVHAARYELASTRGRLGCQELGVVEAEHLVTTNSQLLQELGVSGLADIHVAVLLLVALGVVLHSALEGIGYSHIVNDQSTFLVLVHAVHASNSLHQVVAAHGLVHVHGGKARYVKTGKPHVHNDYYFERVGVIFKTLGHLLDMGLVAHHIEPPFGVLVSHGHNNTELALFLPEGAKLADSLVYSHRSRPRVRHNHRLASELVRTVGFVVLNDVLAQCVNDLGCTQNSIQIRKVALACIDGLGIGLLGELLVLVIDLGEDALVKLERDDTALIEHGARCVVLHGLRHVIDIDIVAKHLASRAVIDGNGRTGETDERRVRQSSTNEQRGARVLLAITVELLLKAILTAMCLVNHHHNVLAVGKRRGFFLELLHSGEDDTVGTSAGDLLGKVGSTLRLHRRLAQEVRALGELREKLRVKVVAVSNHHYGRAIELLFEKMGKKHHRERFARTLCMPEDTAPAIATNGLMHASKCLVHSEVLMIASKNLCILGEQDEVLQDVDETRLGKHAVQGCFPIGELSCLVAAVNALPLYKARLVGGDGADFGVQHIADNAEGIVHKERRNLALVVLDLLIGIFIVSISASRRLQLEKHERQAIHEHDNVGPFVRSALDVGPLVYDMKLVALGIVEIYKAHDIVLIFLAIVPADLHATLQHIREDLVLGNERAALNLFKLGNSRIYGPPVDTGINALKRRHYDIGQKSVVEGVGRAGHIGPMKILVAVCSTEMVDDALLKSVLVEGVDG